MPQTCKPSAFRRIADLLICLATATACAPAGFHAPPATAPAQPAKSPPVTGSPPGVVVPLGGRPYASTFDAAIGRLVVLSPGREPAAPATVTVLGPAQPPRSIALPGPATALTGDGRGTVYLSAPGGYFAVELSTGRIVRTEVDGEHHTLFTAITRRGDGKLVLGSADGVVYLLSGTAGDGIGRNGDQGVGKAAVGKRDKVFARVDALGAQGNTVIVLDRSQTSVTTVNADGDAEQALRAGQGATTLAVDPVGRVLVADTRGGQLLVFGLHPLILHQAYPVRRSPYGLAGSRGLAWVSQTETNMVIGYDLTTGIPVEKVRYPTVRQPNSLAFDDASGTLYVVSGSGDGIQVIEQAAGQQ